MHIFTKIDFYSMNIRIYNVNNFDLNNRLQGVLALHIEWKIIVVDLWFKIFIYLYFYTLSPVYLYIC